MAVASAAAPRAHRAHEQRDDAACAAAMRARARSEAAMATGPVGVTGQRTGQSITELDCPRRLRATASDDL